MPENDLVQEVFMLIPFIIIVIAVVMVFGSEHLRKKKADRASAAITEAARLFMLNLYHACQKTDRPVLKLATPCKFNGIPPSLQTHQQLGALKMHFSSGIKIATPLLIGIIVSVWVILTGLYVYLGNRVEPRVIILFLVIVGGIWAWIFIFTGLFNCQVVLFYEHGLIFIEKRLLDRLANTYHLVELFADIYGIDASAGVEANQFRWSCQFTFNTSAPFCIYGHDLKPLRRLVWCLNNARF